MSSQDEKARAEKLARARQKLKKHQQTKGDAGSPRGSVGAPSPTYSDKASLPGIEDELLPSPASRHSKLASEVPDALFGAASSPHDAFFASSPPTQGASLAEAPAITEKPDLGLNIQLEPEPLGAQQQTINLLVSDKAQLQTQLEQLQKQLEAHEISTRTAQASAESHLSKLKELESSLTVERARLEEGEKYRADLQDQLSSLERQASISKQSASALQDSLEERDAAIVSLKAELAADTKVADLEGRLKAKTSHADTIEAEMSKLRTAHNKLKTDKEAIDEELGTLQSASATAAMSQKQRDAENAKLVADLETAKRAIAEAQTAAETQRAELEGLRSSSTSGDASLQAAKQELTDLRGSLATSQELLAAAESRASIAMTRRDSLQGDNDTLLLQINELREKIVALSNELLAAKDRHDASSRTIRDREADLSKSKLIEEESAVRVRDLEAQIADRDRQITAATERAERAEHDTQYIQDDATARESEITQLREKLSKADAEVARYKTGAEARVAELHALEADLEAAKAELEAEKEEKAQLASDIERIQDTSADLQSQIEELRLREVTPAGSRAPSISAFVNGDSQPSSRSRSPVLSISPSDHRSLSPLMNLATLPSRQNSQTSPNVSPVLQQAKLDGTKQDADLEASQLRSKVRTLEEQAFAEQGRANGLLKQVNVLQAEIAKLEGLVTVERERALKAMREAFAVGAANPLSPVPSPARTPTSGPDLLSPSRLGDATPTLASTATFGGHRRARTEASVPSGSVNGYPFPIPLPSPTLNASIKNAVIPPKRSSHARRVSLNLLKSRMEEELRLPDISLVSATPEIPAVGEEGEEGRFSGEYRHHHRPRAQLGDDIVWCACCKGDLLVM